MESIFVTIALKLYFIFYLLYFQVNVLGDGSPQQSLVLKEFELFDYDYICDKGINAQMPGMVKQTYTQLHKTVDK